MGNHTNGSAPDLHWFKDEYAEIIKGLTKQQLEEVMDFARSFLDDRPPEFPMCPSAFSRFSIEWGEWVIRRIGIESTVSGSVIHVGAFSESIPDLESGAPMITCRADQWPFVFEDFLRTLWLARTR